MSVVDRAPPLPVLTMGDRERSVTTAPAQIFLSPSAKLLAMLSGMRDAKIPYCYWKSASGVERAIAGASDLDLLVDRRSRERLTTLLHEHASRPGRTPPDVIIRRSLVFSATKKRATLSDMFTFAIVCRSAIRC